jgi:hypothetical protein
MKQTPLPPAGEGLSFYTKLCGDLDISDYRSVESIEIF